MTRKLLVLAIAIAAAGCGDHWTQRDATRERISAEMDKAVEERARRALLPPLVVEMPRDLGARPLDQRFDLNVSNAPAAQVFLAIVSGTRYSMIVHPNVREAISVNLKDVTVLEALDTLRELYGYDYRVQGNRITVHPVTLQTRVFHVNYLQATRAGRSDVRVSSGSITDAPTAAGAAGAVGGGPAQRLTESTRITTTSDSNFWGDIVKSISAIVGAADGRNVIVNSQSGVIVVRALPAELRAVESFLKSMQLIVERQVVLEAKIIDVTLREGFEAGINWAAFRDGSTRAAGGVVRPGTTIGNTGPLATPTTLLPDGSIDPASNFAATLGAAASLATGATAPGAVFGLALQTTDFAALLTFLETQGSVNVLSSPRVAAINNQKAVLKVGQDDFFVTNVSATQTTGTGGGVVTTPTITVQPFFSGVALDVTPQIDDNNNIILHVHPQVSRVIEQRKVIDLGATLGTFTLPLASSSVNETDTIVRVQDGNIVAIGGLMRQESVSVDSQVPGLGDVPGLGLLFQQHNRRTTKSEIVILLKPTIVHSDRIWQQDLSDTRERLRTLQPGSAPARQPQQPQQPQQQQ